MKILGITGGSGTGKTTVSKMLCERGLCVIDADIVAREIVECGRPALSEIADEFGAGVIKADGSLDRKALADIVFKNADKLERLNEITHKYIIADIDEKLSKLDDEWAGIDAAALIESGIADNCDKVMAVTADFDVRKERIIRRDGLTEEQAVNRLNAQKDKEFYIRNAVFVIENNSDEYALRMAVDELTEKLGLKR